MDALELLVSAQNYGNQLLRYFSMYYAQVLTWKKNGYFYIIFGILKYIW